LKEIIQKKITMLARGNARLSIQNCFKIIFHTDLIILKKQALI